MAAADGQRTVRADLMIGDRLKSILEQSGPSVYATFEKEAAALYERGKKEQDARVLDDLCRAYPLARVVPDALLELGRVYEREGRLADASHTYRRLQVAGADPDRRVRAALAACACVRGEEAAGLGTRLLP